MSVLKDDDRPTVDSVDRWIATASSRYDELLDRIDRAYFRAETCARAADERTRERAAAAAESISEQPWINDELLPNVHTQAMNAYAGVASALLSSLREMQLHAATVEMPVTVRQ